MKIHHLHSEQILNISLSEAWDFFSNPNNLNEITPPELYFRNTNEVADEMYEGQIITYRIRLAPMVWQTWVTEIKAVISGRQFVDEQRYGPYKFWHHRHSFEETKDGKARIVDDVHWALPFAPFSNPVNALYVTPQVKRIFGYREEVLEKKFN